MRADSQSDMDMEITASIKPPTHNCHLHHTFNIAPFSALNPPDSPTGAFFRIINHNNNNNWFSVSSSSSSSSSSRIAVLVSDDDDIEMITLQAAAAAASPYTSLKDLMPPTSPNSVLIRKHSSVRDTTINLKHPLLQHAALAYLQPACNPDDTQMVRNGNNFLLNLKHHCGAVFRCCFNGVILVLVRICSPASSREEEDQENASSAGGRPCPCT